MEKSLSLFCDVVEFSNKLSDIVKQKKAEDWQEEGVTDVDLEEKMFSYRDVMELILLNSRAYVKSIAMTLGEDSTVVNEVILKGIERSVKNES